MPRKKTASFEENLQELEEVSEAGYLSPKAVFIDGTHIESERSGSSGSKKAGRFDRLAQWHLCH